MAYKIKKYKKSKQTPISIPITSPFEAVVVLILGAGICLFNYIKEHPIVGVILGGVIVTFVVLAVYYRKKKWEEYLKWFYSRSRRLEELNANDLIDLNFTKAIEEALKTGKAVPIGEETASFGEFRSAYQGVWNCLGRKQGSETLVSQGQAMNGRNGVTPKCEPIVFKYVGEHNGGYAFYVFPEATLAYVEGPEKTVFLAAFKPQALNILSEETSYEYKQVVQEKTQYEIRYYDKFNPIPDATIISSHWEVENKNGSRSFKGGLLPEHNPLHFNLQHGAINFHFGDYEMRTVFSNYSAVEELADYAEDYSKGRIYRKPANFSRNISSSVTKQRPGESDLDVINRVLDSLDEPEERIEEKPKVSANKTNDIFGRTDVSLERRKVVQAQANGSIVEEKPKAVVSEEPIKKEPDVKIDIPQQSKPEIIEEKNSLTEESARSRNREAAKAVVDALNKKYNGIYDFKVYQVRKAREGWGVQDSGVYTYTTDNQGNQYTIEFDLHTNLDIPKTDLKFSVWGKTKELVAERYKVTVTKGKMHVDGEGYSCTINRQYEGISQASMIAQFEKDVFTLMKLIDLDSKS